MKYFLTTTKIVTKWGSILGADLCVHDDKDHHQCLTSAELYPSKVF